MFMYVFSILLTFLLYVIFFIFSKSSNWDYSSKNIFECGFTSFFYSRFSFSIQYFLVALTFLFLDLEICFLLPFFNEDSQNFKVSFFFMTFFFIMTLGLLIEWKIGLIEWKI